MKLRTFWAVCGGGARAGGAPPKSASDKNCMLSENVPCFSWRILVVWNSTESYRTHKKSKNFHLVLFHSDLNNNSLKFYVGFGTLAESRYTQRPLSKRDARGKC